MIHYMTTNGIGNAWVAVELKYLKESGIPVVLHSMRSPRLNFFGSDWAKKIDQETRPIYPIKLIGFIVSIIAAPFLFRKYFFQSLFNALFSERENFRARISCIAHLFVAADWARRIRHEKITLIHSQWIQSCGSIAWYAAWLLDKPFSFTGHAVDLFRERSALRDKIASAKFIISISEFHKNFYIKLGSTPEKIYTVYCGIDVDDFAYDFKPMSEAIRILSFGRLVEKKGFDTLIEACSILRNKGLEFECEIAGSGPDEKLLTDMVTHLDLSDQVKVTGKPLLQEDIKDWLKQGNIFAQPCCWSKDNDVDGIPRSLMEAMACGLPSISTSVAGIPDLVKDGESGLLIEEKNPEALAESILRLVNDNDLAKNISLGGRRHMEEHFNLKTCLLPLAELYKNELLVDNAATTLDNKQL
ncbi:MAG: glycosyltransferase [Candidatus Sedimenticola sp. (ex Thyasira tokunagai)]